MKNKRILFLMSGSIAAYKACQAASDLIKLGCELQFAITDSTLNFIGLSTLEGLSGRPVFKDLNEQGHAMDHIHLARWADVIVIAPASANTIASLSTGFTSDPVSCLVVANNFKKPVLIFPAMNSEMWLYPATQDNFEKLKKWGARIFTGVEGKLACGEYGVGRMSEPSEIVNQVKESLRGVKHHRTRLKVFITGGGCQEAIDGVRKITNSSTGQTSKDLARFFVEKGHFVHLGIAKSSLQPAQTIPDVDKVTEFTDFQSLYDLIKNDIAFEDYNLFIHAAAVSDYSVDKLVLDGQPIQDANNRKISSSKDLTIVLKPNPKILGLLGGWTLNKKMKIVGFKLTHDMDPRDQLNEVKKQFQECAPDLVVLNDYSQIDNRSNKHLGSVFQKNMEQQSFQTNSELAEILLTWAEQSFDIETAPSFVQEGFQ